LDKLIVAFSIKAFSEIRQNGNGRFSHLAYEVEISIQSISADSPSRLLYELATLTKSFKIRKILYSSHPLVIANQEHTYNVK